MVFNKRSVMKFLKLNAEAFVEVSREARGDDSWDRGDTKTYWYVNGIELVEDDKYMCVKNYLDAKVGDRIFVVYAVYSTGDSFGNDEDKNLEFINVFSCREDANACAEILSNARETATYVLSNGERVSYGYIPWSGYFERLSYIEVEEFTVGGAKKRWYPKNIH